MFVPPKTETKNKIPADPGHFSRKKIDLTDFKNEHLTTKIRKNKAEKSHSFKEKYSKRFWNTQNH